MGFVNIFFSRKSMDLKDKSERLTARIRALKSFVVAFSGGVDSTFLLAVAHGILGDAVLAVTAASPLHPPSETESAIQLARAIGAPHMVIGSSEMNLPEFVENRPDRCYLCKTMLFTELTDIARKKGFNLVADGANMDDLQDFRPGMKATRELGIVSPLMEASLGKADIRKLSKEMQLPTWNKPAMACLASRIPYGVSLTPDRLKKVAEAEAILWRAGFGACRVRYHGSVARIEIPLQQVEALFREDTRRDIVKQLRAVGFDHIAVDMEGYTQGSMNRGVS